MDGGDRGSFGDFGDMENRGEMQNSSEQIADNNAESITAPDNIVDTSSSSLYIMIAVVVILIAGILIAFFYKFNTKHGFSSMKAVLFQIKTRFLRVLIDFVKRM